MTQVIKKVWFRAFCLFTLTVLLVVGCTRVDPSNREDSSSSQTDVPTEITTPNAEHTSALRDRIEQISQAAQGKVGVTATVVETEESVSFNGEQQFPMQSVYKFPIAMAVLAQVDQGHLNLDQKIRIEASDIIQDSRILDENSQGMEFSLTELL